MGEYCYVIQEIPDITLGKYESLANNGVDGVLKLHLSFLKQLHEKSFLTGVTMHLLYCYRNTAQPGNKISIFFLARGKDFQLENIDNILAGNSLSDYFHFSILYRRDDFGELVYEASGDSTSLMEVLFGREYKYCSALTKEEVFFDGLDGNTYYNVPAWKPNPDGRLYEMLRIMQSLDKDCIYRIDITAEKKNRSLRKSLSSGPIPNLHQLQNASKGGRDYAADTFLRSYEDLLKALDSMQHFSANIFVFSDSPEDGSMVIASAASEAIINGDFHIANFTGHFDALSFLEKEEESLYSLDENDEFVIAREKGKTKILSSTFLSLPLKALSYLPTLFTLDELAPLFRFPCLHDGETLSIRKETVAPLHEGSNSIFLGKDSNDNPVNIPMELFPKHAFISGVPGSGKTNAMHHITYTLWKKGIPFLVLEPAKKEYRALCNLPEMKDVRLFSPCSNMSFPLHINPFEFAKGLSVSEHIRTLCSVFEGAFPLDNPMPFLLENAIETVYRNKGWLPETVYTDELVHELEFPTLSMLYSELEQELTRTTYSGEVKGNLESALKVRIGSLLRREMGDVFDVSRSSLSPEEWLTIPAIVELESMGQGPANFLTLMLCSLIRECLKVNPSYTKGAVRHVIFIEEAHNLIGPDSEVKNGDGANAKVAATAFIVKMLAEVRALKESIFIADQLPTAMAQEVIKNTGLKIALRLTAMDDRQLLCNSMSANGSQIEGLATFQIGEALVSYEKLQRPFKMRVHRWCNEMSEEERNQYVVSKTDAQLVQDLINNKAFRDNIGRSLAIEFDKLIATHRRLNEDVCKLISMGRECNLWKTRLDKLDDENRESTEKAATIINDIYAGNAQLAFNDPEYADLLIKIDDSASKIKAIQKILYERSEDVVFLTAGKLVKDLCSLAVQIINKVNRFCSLGVAPTDKEVKLYLQDNAHPSLNNDVRRLLYLRINFISIVLNDAAVVYKEASKYTEMSVPQFESIERIAKSCGVALKFSI